jgi:hypothetical protein
MDLPVLALAEHHSQRRSPSFDGESRHLSGPRGPSVDVDTLTPPHQVRVLHDAVHLGKVDLGRLLARMEQTERKIAVVGEQERARGAEVEASHGNDAGTDVLHVLGHRGAPRGVRHGAHHVPRLVKHEVHECLLLHPAPVHLDTAALRVGLGPELRDDASVHGDTPPCDQFFRASTGSNAPPRQDFLQPFGRHFSGP